MSAVDRKLILETVLKQGLWVKSGASNGLRDRKGFAAVHANWLRTFKLVSILAILVAHHSNKLSTFNDISLKATRRRRRQLAAAQRYEKSYDGDDDGSDASSTAAGGTPSKGGSGEKAATSAKVRRKTARAAARARLITLNEDDFDDDTIYCSKDALEEREFGWDIIIATLVFQGTVYNWVQKFKDVHGKGPQPYHCLLALQTHC